MLSAPWGRNSCVRVAPKATRLSIVKLQSSFTSPSNSPCVGHREISIEPHEITTATRHYPLLCAVMSYRTIAESAHNTTMSSHRTDAEATTL